ncbi:hypothetical protein WS83_21520 [Burkholderia sp. MSMB2042]|nr:hypothetical protein WS78_27755 [Burkholderia savannae]KVG46171.1 hypothetical protein WS77_30935 [Burkholderia sp. MSMB0265]KVG89683.1 hypothetical protein WS81_21860 [Burkholderia sp. MSMB2040]KVG91697.1 hypothetical protein WS82_13870 [Burkholderia sp. MSMB2041]KVH00916.1 hypothetical protein WS83_21520 [Burkholderia sp. MSMB2042]KVK90084.1 hypothetical protein WS91_27100 [Burkholderia sp. MSMB1498]
MSAGWINDRTLGHGERISAMPAEEKARAPRPVSTSRTHRTPARKPRNAIGHAFTLADDQIEAAPSRRTPRHGDVRRDALPPPLGATLARSRQRFIAASLEYFNGDKPRIAKALGIGLEPLHNRLTPMRVRETEAPR